MQNDDLATPKIARLIVSVSRRHVTVAQRCDLLESADMLISLIMV